MPDRCETCGNHYDRIMRIELDGETHLFDSFECAIQKLAPVCAHCGTRVIGHGVQIESAVFCCAHCARALGMAGFTDRLSEKKSA